MGAKLDRSRSFGTVHGSDTGACYEQDHKEFNNEGEEIVKAGAKSVAPADDAPPAAVVVTVDAAGNLSKDGVILDLEGMELDDLHALAASMGLTLHARLGAAKTAAAITDAAVPADQLSQQLQ